MRLVKRCNNCGGVIEFSDRESAETSPIPRQRKCPQCGKSQLAKYNPPLSIPTLNATNNINIGAYNFKATNAEGRQNELAPITETRGIFYNLEA